MADTSSPRPVFPGSLLLDDLELLHWGVFDLPLLVIDLPPGRVVVTDAEGVPFAELTVAESGHFLAQMPVWRSPRSARPFESLHRPPEEVPPGPVVLLSHPVSPALLQDACSTTPEGGILACLASLDGEPDPVSLELVRLARAAAERDGRWRLVVVPVARVGEVLSHRKTAVGAAYARGARITDLTVGVPDRPFPAPAVSEGAVLFFTGLSGSGKSTLARAVRNHLLEEGQRVSLLDGDLVRRHLSAGLGFSQQDRDTNIRRIGYVAAEIAHHGGMAICSPIAPFDRTRQDVRRMVEGRGGRFILVHVATPLEECERRDRKGLYARARRGEIADFTGISSPYEVPADAELRIDTSGRNVADLKAGVLGILQRKLSPPFVD